MSAALLVLGTAAKMLLTLSPALAGWLFILYAIKKAELPRRQASGVQKGRNL